MRALALLLCASALQADVRFEVSFPEEHFDEAYSGRVYVVLSSARSSGDPGPKMHTWFGPPPVLAIDVAEIEPGGRVLLAPGGAVLGHPHSIEEFPAGSYRAQAVVRVDPDSPKAGLGEGDWLSEVTEVVLARDEDLTVALSLTRPTARPTLTDEPRAHAFELESERLSAFHGRPITMRGAVLVPDGWEIEVLRDYPVVYFVMGFGQTHVDGVDIFRRYPPDHPSRKVLVVLPDPSCYWGHHVLANSALNGPWGDAFTHEFVPAVEEAFRGARSAEQRYLTGGSSGGWASLWAQLQYPEHFAGVASMAPDPVDYRSFLGEDLYREGANVYRDAQGAARPFLASSNRVWFTVEDFFAREHVLGPGGQLRSLEAVFSPVLADGTPRPLFDRATGAVDPVTASAWRAHDIGHLFRTSWNEDWNGKVKIWAGDKDEFDLDGAVALLAATVEEHARDAHVEVIEGLNHQLHKPGMDALWETALERWARR